MSSDDASTSTGAANGDKICQSKLAIDLGNYNTYYKFSSKNSPITKHFSSLVLITDQGLVLRQNVARPNILGAITIFKPLIGVQSVADLEDRVNITNILRYNRVFIEDAVNGGITLRTATSARYSVEQVLSVFLEQIRADTCATEQFSTICLTVPLNFTVSALSMYRTLVAKVFKVEAKNIIDIREPVAAFLGSSSLLKVQGDQQKRVLLVDIGHGTADCALFEVGGLATDRCKLVSVKGSTKCAGANFDKELVDHLLKEFVGTLKDPEIKKWVLGNKRTEDAVKILFKLYFGDLKPTLMAGIYDGIKMDIYKQLLSTVRIEMAGLPLLPEEKVPKIYLTVAQIVSLCNRPLDCFKNLVESAVGPGVVVHQVIRVGGGCFAHGVHEILCEVFPDAQQSRDSIEEVTLSAVVQGAYKCTSEDARRFDVVPHNFCYGYIPEPASTPDCTHVEIIFPRGELIPVEGLVKVPSNTLKVNDQKKEDNKKRKEMYSMVFNLYEDPSSKLEHFKPLPAPGGFHEFEVKYRTSEQLNGEDFTPRFTLARDASGNLKVDVKMSSGQKYPQTQTIILP